ncbi:MAG: AraC family transcriptional regulator [Candidatus Devosia phytovorans]|uniref:AraC family transcriptional regulator n=1 Tax=Candidatus Devosia phytovorans TaxID=3121372 RepID=A0AAJ5VT01_9HYPH|nr:AraC family transcriptional regulator [Devosia sp.]WEK03762.1 MAG: AraC family transcriptional regulator [Devosia sp.]
MFHPQMQSRIEGFAPNGGPNWRSWQGMLADVWDVQGEAGAGGEYVSPHARLFVILDETPADAILLTDDPGRVPDGAAGRLSYIPPNMRTWSIVPRQARLCHLDLHLDLGHLRNRLGLSLDALPGDAARLMFDNPVIQALSGLLARECQQAARHDAYGESLALAICVELFELPRQALELKGQLSPRRLRMACKYLGDRCLEAVRLQDLAEHVGLSSSYFSAAFKASTGLSPLQWQMRARIERVKALLESGAGSLSHLAGTTGFADQAHMTRVFKQYTGQTPLAWLKARERAL